MNLLSIKMFLKEKYASRTSLRLSFFLLMSVLSFCALAQVPTNGLVAYYPFNGNANDESGNGNTPTFNNATLATDRFGNANKAYSFNGINNKIVIPDANSLDLSTTGTISLWIKQFGANLDQFNNAYAGRIIDKGTPGVDDGYLIDEIHSASQQSTSYCSASNGRIRFIGGGGFNADECFPYQIWHHVVVTFDNGTAKYYMNGILKKTTQLRSTIPVNNLPLVLGYTTRDGYSSYYYNGLLDDIRIYNRALNGTEVTQLYQAEAPPVTLQTGLVAYYPFNGNANDESGNGNNGVVNGATLTTDRFGNANKAYGFDGISNYITLPSTISNNLSSYTIILWLKPLITSSRLEGYEPISDRDAVSYKYKFRINYGISNQGFVNDTTYIQTCNNCSNTNSALFTKVPHPYKWVQYVITYDAILKQFKAYNNGEFLGSLNNIIMPDGNRLINLGRTLSPAYPQGVSWFKGDIDDIRIYNRALSYAEVQQLYSNTANNITIAQPQITLSATEVAIGGTMTIRGENFNPFGKVYLDFYGAADRYRDSTVADINGKFTFPYTASAARAQAGMAAVRVIDVIRNLNAPGRTFEITTPIVTPRSYLTIAAPTASQSYEATRPINVTWNDIMFRRNGTFTYPMFPRSANRVYSYKIEYQVGANGAWQTLTNVGGGALLNSSLVKTIPLVINTPNAACRVRVTDNLLNTIVATSEVFAVTPYNTNINASLEWDYSFPNMTNLPTLEGVAAEGTSRCYIKVGKKAGFTPNLVSATVTLSSNNIAATPQYLGKLKAATNISSFSTEADNATATTLINTNIQNNAIWFWYVSPDDFSDNTATHNNASERIVTATINATFSDGSTETTTQPIKIVRPPLMMVHGLNSEAATWTEFKRQLNVDALFKYSKAVEMLPGAAFDNNARKLVNIAGANDASSFQYNIAALRRMGFAANKVDYVCHSMGGCMMRYAINNYPIHYLGLQSYAKGFINKAITINTPHNGSVWANVITEIAPDIPYENTATFATFVLYELYNTSSNLFNIPPLLVNLVQRNGLTWQATPAVQNLQIRNGVSLGETAVKNHLISSNTNICNTDFRAEGLEYLNDLAIILMEYTLLRNPNDLVLRELFTNQTRTDAQRLCAFFDWYTNRITQRSDNPFNGDGVVSLSSQLAGNSAVNVPTNASIFRSPSLSETLKYFHTGIHQQNFTVERAKMLLNSNVSSDKFGNTINRTNGLLPNDPTGGVVKMSPLADFYDTLKVKITNPLRNNVLQVDSLVNITYNLKDTNNLVYVRTSFQGRNYLSTNRAAYQAYSVGVSPNFMGIQQIVVVSAYSINGAIEKHIDTLSVSVQTNATLVNFEVNPEVKELDKGIPFNPAYSATYSTFIANVPNNDTNISVVVDNPNIVSYNLANRYFVGIDTGSTFATVTYRGFRDTIYFSVADTASITTSTQNIWSETEGKKLDMRVYPNPTQGQFILELEKEVTLENAKILIINTLGQVIQEHRFTGQRMIIDLSTQSQGIYFVRLTTANGAEAIQKIQKW